MISRLLERRLPYYRLNADELSRTQFTLHIADRKVSRRLWTTGAHVDLDAVGCVWYRRSLRPPPPEAVDPKFHSFAREELRHLYEGLVADESLRWVNPLAATELGERKVLQLRLAQETELQTPATLISSDVQAIEEFACTHDGVICKPISQGLVVEDAEWYAVHTHELSPGELRERDHIGKFPTLLQRLVPKGVDVRVTIIGADTYTVEIHVPKGTIDWRAAGSEATYSICALPERVERGCRELMSRLNLLFGAFDFIRTVDDEWYFLEVNPAGEWAWLERDLGLPMRDSFVQLFYGR